MLATKMKVSGLRGKSSPMNRATLAQALRVEMLREQAADEGVRRFEVRYPVYIGDLPTPCAATRGAITVMCDGYIAWNVEKDGSLT